MKAINNSHKNSNKHTTKIIQIASRLEKISVWSGQSISWLTLLMVILTFAIVVLRYGFGMGWIAMQESVIYMYALVFLIGIPYTLKHDGHVRVDIFYSKMKPRNKAWVNLFGTLFLLIPVTIFIAWVSWDYVTASWALKEESGEAGGLPGVYLLKSTILVMTFLLFIQGISQLLLNIAILRQPPADKKMPDDKEEEAE